MMDIIKNIKNKVYFLFNKIIIYSFSKLQSLDKQYSINNNTKYIKKNNTIIIQNINNYNNNEEMYGHFIYLD
jgi:hypothetical protein